MKYDDASWHYGGEFPKDLPDQAGATHTGMFVAWALLSGLAGQIHVADFPEDLEALRARSVTPGEFFYSRCDGKFVDENLNDQGNAFASAYFDLDRGSYLADYERVLVAGLPSLYHVPDTWHSYDQLKPTLDSRFAEWQAAADASAPVKTVSSPIRPFFRVLALGLAAVAAWWAVAFAKIAVLFGAGLAFQEALGYGALSLGLFAFALLAGAIGFTARLARLLVGSDDRGTSPTGTV